MHVWDDLGLNPDQTPIWHLATVFEAPPATVGLVAAFAVAGGAKVGCENIRNLFGKNSP